MPKYKINKAIALTLPQQAIALFLRFSVRRSHFSSTTGDRLVFEVFCKTITHSCTTGDRIFFEVFCKAIAHSSTTGDRFIFEIFCKAIALTLPQQAIA
ncbi:hypothetical protein [Nostoc sp. UHCC 0252]|uniref:hypothetical protein n=1 Tax=Nostoc sp. UHCC 0252 TaxID=3110241 RepID=UPI002B1F51DE|nr:hypothetical protein [Nostoc sp. UHCC 0252]MEA5599628.1 hypothetical protein [Nostoc sp. UHCC 0252]